MIKTEILEPIKFKHAIILYIFNQMINKFNLKAKFQLYKHLCLSINNVTLI